MSAVVNPLNPFNEQEELSAPEKELISTETSYCEQLSTLIEVFADPLSRWISNMEADIKAKQRSDYQIEMIKEELEDKHSSIDEAIFSNIRQLLDCSRELLSALVEASKSGSKSIVMDTFRRHAPFLTMYSTYTSNFTSANSLLQRLQLDPRFASFIKCGELQARCKGLTLPSFLILPVQRTPRYGLLIKEAIKMCSDETGVKLLMETYQLTNSVTKRIDSKIEEQERRNKLIHVQDMLGIELLAPAREFIRDGSLTKICHTGRKDFYFVLCTDKLIYATESTGFLRSGQRYSVNKNYNLYDVLFVIPDDENDQNRSFFLCSKDKAFEIEAPTKDIANAWVEDIERLKTRRTVQQWNAEKPWYQAECVPGFSLYAMDRNSVIVSTYRIRSGADMSCGIISFTDLVAVIVDDEPSGLQRPQSSSGYKRMDSFTQNADNGSDRGSESSMPEIAERRSSFSNLLKHAFGGRPSPATVDDRVRQAHMSEPIPIIPFPSKDSDQSRKSLKEIPEESISSKHLEIDGDSDAETDLPVSSGPAPRLGEIGRMNTADFRLFGGDSAKSVPAKPVEPFVLLTKPKLDTENFVPTMAARPAMPSTAPPPPPIPQQPIYTPDIAGTEKAGGGDDSSVGSNKATLSSARVTKGPSSNAQAKQTAAGKLAPSARGSKPTPALPAPPPPAINRRSSGSHSSAPPPAAVSNRTAAARVVKAATAKPKKPPVKAHVRNNSDDSSTGSKAVGRGAPPQPSKGILKDSSTVRPLHIEPSAPPMDVAFGLSPKFGGSTIAAEDCKAMADAVAGVHIDSLTKATPITHQRPPTVGRSSSLDSHDVAIGNVKCVLCDSILAYKIGTDPNAVVNQHIAQVHGLD